MMTSRSPRMDPKGIAQELLRPISPLRQKMASVEDNVPRVLGPMIAQGHASPLAHVHHHHTKEIQCSAKLQIPSKNKVFVEVTRPL